MEHLGSRTANVLYGVIGSYIIQVHLYRIIYRGIWENRLPTLHQYLSLELRANK